MFSQQVQSIMAGQLAEIRDGGLYKEERVIVTPQSAAISVRGGQEVINFCANNYLGLSDHPQLIEAASRTLRERGFGMSSVRFICGTLDIHTELEESLSRFLGTANTILYSSCFDANGGLFETLLGPEDAVISDALNHASIIDGIRLCKAQRHRYANSDMGELEARLKESSGARIRLIATDGVFSMDGYVAKLEQICDLADQYDAMVMVDDSHAVGFMGRTGRGTHEHCGVMDRVDIITGTLGKALGGASGGYTSGRSEIIELLRQRSRPYLFSNTLAPAVAGAAIEALAMLSETTELRDRLESNTRKFRDQMSASGFEILPGNHPIVPIMLGDARLAGELAARVLELGIYVIGFSYPVVPRGQARIRVQLSAAHTDEHIAQAVAAFEQAGRELAVIS
ncbi:MAG: glycine C-acetyltransferase [Rickettsiales bacterium]|nr:glycine C-acetyltransferase [Rickettsiales bacterium]|tara:strand:- start:2260 stop:3453 length:1194 start_codon:yes stop_codon:yes gene_type:complete